jgi:hypothetical protein
VSKIGVQKVRKKVSKKVQKKVQKKVRIVITMPDALNFVEGRRQNKKSFKKSSKKGQKKVRKIIIKNYKLLEGRGGRGGWRIVIPMPKALSFAESCRQKCSYKNVITVSINCFL